MINHMLHQLELADAYGIRVGDHVFQFSVQDLHDLQLLTTRLQARATRRLSLRLTSNHARKGSDGGNVVGRD